jgi:hypothetical protein
MPTSIAKTGLCAQAWWYILGVNLGCDAVRPDTRTLPEALPNQADILLVGINLGSGSPQRGFLRGYTTVERFCEDFQA